MFDEIEVLNDPDRLGLIVRAQSLADAALAEHRADLAGAHRAVAEAVALAFHYDGVAPGVRYDGVRKPDVFARRNILGGLRDNVRTLPPVDRHDFTSAWDAEAPGAGGSAAACMAIAHCADVDDDEEVGGPMSDSMVALDVQLDIDASDDASDPSAGGDDDGTP